MNRFLMRACVAFGCVGLLSGADWLQFRGNDANGIAGDQQLPKTLSGENIAWKVPVPGRGLSGPIVIGDRVIVTCSSGYRQDRLHVVCFDAHTGEERWHRQFWATGRTSCHNKMCVATPTPASDGERIFAFYSSNDLACLDLDGNLLWYRGLTYDFPNASNSLGMASSPVVVNDTLVVQVESDAEAFATGVDVKTGLSLWKMDRPRRANWTSPAVLKDADGKPALALLQSSAGVTAVHPKTGDIVWNYDQGASTIPSTVVVDQTVYIPSNGLTALKPGLQADSEPEVLWNANRLSPSTPSPLVYRGRTYTVNRSGVLASADAQSGELLWQLRLGGPFSSTPIAADGHLYFFDEKGLAQVVHLGDDEGEIVSELDLSETILCTPAAADNAIFVRSDDHLWKIANPN